MTNAPPIESKDDLVAYLEAGCKPKEAWRIGSEHEKFVYRFADLAPAPFEGPRGIEAHLEAMRRFGWQPKYESGNLVALRADGASITLEPGGQLELSGAPLENLHQTCAEVNDHLAQVKLVGDELGTGFLGIGFHPTARREDIPWMPKERYRIMRAYMPKKGRLGLDMMLRTCTVQVNLDFSDEADMVRKFRVGLALQPIATALFANSPFTEGKPNGFQSYRSHIWTDTDPDRTGMLPFVFDEGFGFERWVDYVLDVPMYFVERGETMVDVAGASFRDLMAGRLAALPGERATMKDWEDHLTTPFPEVRMKTFLEMRGADGGPWSRLCALPALWVGLLYEQEALDAAWDLCKDWTIAEQEALRRDVPRLALDTPFRGRPLRETIFEVIRIAELGLRKRGRLNASGDSEQIFLKTLWDITESGQTPADELLARFHGDWAGDVRPVFREYCY